MSTIELTDTETVENARDSDQQGQERSKAWKEES